MERITIHSLAADTSITVWWEKPVLPPKGYNIFLNGQLAQTTSRTHATLTGLEPDTEYEVRLVMQRTEAAQMPESTAASEPEAARRTVSAPMEDTRNEKLQKNGNGVGTSAVIRTQAVRRRLDVTKAPYYAKGDGMTRNTAVLQQALDDCGPGDCVYIPAGVFLTGALRGHSDVEIYLEEGAVLQGTDAIEDYLPRIPSRFEGMEMECYSSVLNFGTLDHNGGPNCHNVWIHGRGTIASGGKTLAWRIIEDERERLKDDLEALGDLVKECENDNTIPGRVRPRLINLSNCRKVRISGLTLQNGASWNLHMIYCKEITTDHCVFRSEGVWNGDGWDPDSSENCTLFAAKFYTGDDAVAIKSGKNPEGNQINRPTRHIRVFDCYSAFGHGICIGSEMSGGVEDVKIWDCDLAQSQNGLEIKATKKRGGYVRNVTVQDCTLPRIMMHSVGYNDDGIGAPVPPVFENCLFERLKLLGRYQDADGDGSMKPCAAIELAGFDAPGHELRKVTFRDIALTGEGMQTIQLQWCDGVRMENISVKG
ncbi:MAG: glycosyl hydrolase family 28 protein [Lachnospiraceae bacterium]|nr:glycosyl hydrolase family 28 protein [Lachnospiraceae bacterium]MDO5551178.1 glycosyl hydrolase family 28 protein [Lachnospiraceae bacterium]